jgi:hypothetical protein
VVLLPTSGYTRKGPLVTTAFAMTLDWPLTVKDRLRLCEKVDTGSTDDDCWEWRGTRCKKGYGVFSLRSKQWKAHRLLFLLEHGRLPDLDLDHLCCNRGCVNPWHLEEVNIVTNVMRGDSPHATNARKQVCGCGRAYGRRGNGHRYCPTCNKRSKK